VGFVPIFRVSFFAVAWVVIGFVVAIAQDYFDSLGTVGRVLTAIAAVLLWPLLLLGFDIQISR
jgi:energy-converting hydrogenase Eha subunit C